MRTCRKCDKTIPARVKIEGKERNLQNRKFCLTCSPWRSHNTKSDDPSRPAIKKSCYAEWGDDQKKKNMLSLLKRGTERKGELVRLSGGKCLKCGYSKCNRALTFHHRNPEQKNFPLTKNNLWSKSWETILEEHAKCDLLCMNCHTELEEEIESHKEINYHKWLG